MILYEFACAEHGRFEAFGASGARVAPCPRCGAEGARRFSVPVTDCRSFGKNQMPARVRPVDRKPANELSEELIRGYQVRDRTHQKFGAGKTTGR